MSAPLPIKKSHMKRKQTIADPSCYGTRASKASNADFVVA